MRILQVHTAYRQRGGEDSVAEAERNLLTGAGHDVEFIEFRNPEGSGASVAALARAAWNERAAARVVEAAHRFRPDVVHVHNTWFALSPAVFRRLQIHRFPVITTIHNYRTACVNALLYRNGTPCEDCLGRIPWRGVAHRCYRGSAIQSAAVALTIETTRRRRVWHDDVDVVIALTSFQAARLVASGIPEDRIVVKPNFVMDPGARPRSPSASRTLLFVGRMAEEKGVLDLVEAWKGSGEGPLELVMVGGGPLLDEVRRRVPRTVTLTGELSRREVHERLRDARALLVPSRWYEGMPMVVLEGLASGTGVVVPDHGPLGDVVAGGGLTFRGLDPSSLAEALARLGDDEFVERLGREARSVYESAFSPSRALDALIGAYESARERRRRPSSPER